MFAAELDQGSGRYLHPVVVADELHTSLSNIDTNLCHAWSCCVRNEDVTQLQDQTTVWQGTERSDVTKHLALDDEQHKL